MAAIGAAFGARRGLAGLAGVVCGMIVVMAIIASGLAGLLLALPGATPVVTGVAAAYIAYLAWRIATAPPLHGRGRARPPSLVGGLALALLNPKAYAAMAALFSGFVLIQGRPELDAALKTVALVAMIIPVNLAWLAAGSALTRRFHEPASNRAINIGFAVLLLLSVGLALLL